MKNRPIHIAMLGTRGIPANYGGFETFTEELSTRIVPRGFRVTVYCRKGAVNCGYTQYKGVRLVFFPTIKHKYLDTVAHTFLSTLHVLFTDVDIVFYCNTINSVFTILPRIFGKKTMINVDGLEWKRSKWNRLGKSAYRLSEMIACLFLNVIITDSRAIQDYYLKKFGRRTVYIAYGTKDRHSLDNADEIIAKFGLKRKSYLLHVGRLVPENNTQIMIQAYAKVKSDLPLVIVGDAAYDHDYARNLYATEDKRVKFLGRASGQDYLVLQDNALLYLHGHEVGGTNLALLDAMAGGSCVVAIGVPFNTEVIADSGVCFDPGKSEDLKNKIEYLLNHPEDIEKYKTLARKRIDLYYRWDAVISAYERLFEKIVKRNNGS